MYKYIFTISLLLTTGSTFGQDFIHKSPDEFKFGVRILTGYQYGQIGELNEQLSLYYFDEINANFINLGTGIFFGFNRHTLNIYGRFYKNGETEFNDLGYKVSHFGYAVGFNYGFDFYLSGLIITPNLGLRRDFFDLSLLNGISIDNDFVQNLSVPNGSELTSEIMGLDVGMRILSEHDSESFNPGIEIGYTVPLTRDWHVSDLDIPDGPKINPTSFRIGIILQFYIRNYVD